MKTTRSVFETEVTASLAPTTLIAQVPNQLALIAHSLEMGQLNGRSRVGIGGSLERLFFKHLVKTRRTGTTNGFGGNRRVVAAALFGDDSGNSFEGFKGFACNIAQPGDGK